VATYRFHFNADQSNYTPIVNTNYSHAYTGTVKQGDIIEVTVNYSGSQSVSDIVQFHWGANSYNLDMNSNNNSPYTLGWTRLSGGSATSRTYRTVAADTSNDNYIRGFFFARAGRSAAGRKGVRFLMLPTDGSVGFTTSSYSAGVAGTATYQATTDVDAWMRGEYSPNQSGTDYNNTPSWEVFKSGSLQYALRFRSHLSTQTVANTKNKGNYLFWRIVDSSSSHTSSSNFNTPSGFLDSPQSGDTVTIHPKANVSGTYYLNLYHYNSEGDYRNGLPANTTVGASYDLIRQTSFTVAAGVQAPTLSNQGIQHAGGYLMPTNPTGGTSGATVVYKWSAVTRNGHQFSYHTNPTLRAAATLGVGGEWHGSTWTVFAEATLGSNTDTSNTISFTLPTQDENVSIPPQFLNSTSTYQNPILTVNSGSTNNNTIYFVSSIGPTGTLDNQYLNALANGPFDAANTTVPGRTYNLNPTRNIRSTSGGAGAFMTDIPAEQTADTYYIYSMHASQTPANVSYTGRSYIVERPDTNVTVTPATTSIDSYAVRARNNINVDLSNDIGNTNGQYRLITVAGTKYNPYGYSQPTVEISAANGAWVATTVSPEDFDGTGGSSNLDDWQDLPADGHSVQYQCQVRIRSDRGGVGTTAAFQDCPGATFTITAGAAVVAPQTSSLTIHNEGTGTQVTNGQYTARLTLSSAGSGGGQLQYAIERDDSTPDNWVNASSDSQTTFDVTFNRQNNPGTLYGHARRIDGSSVFAATTVRSVAALPFLDPHLTGYSVSSPSLTNGTLSIAHNVGSVTVRITRSGGFTLAPYVQFKLKVNNSQVSSTQTLTAGYNNEVVFPLSTSDLPTNGNNQTYQLTANRPTTIGGEGVDKNTNLSFIIAKGTQSDTDPDPQTGPSTPTQPFGDYGMIVFGPDGQTLILTPDFRGFNVVDVNAGTNFTAPGTSTTTSERIIDVDYGATDDNLIVILNQPRGIGGAYFDYERAPNGNDNQIKIKSINSGIWSNNPNSQLQCGWQIIRI